MATERARGAWYLDEVESAIQHRPPALAAGECGKRSPPALHLASISLKPSYNAEPRGPAVEDKPAQ